MKTDPATPKRKRASAQTAPRFLGAVDGLHDGLLYGWAIDTEQPDARVVVEICLNDEAIASVIADTSRGDLDALLGQRAAPADPCHGFIADIGAIDAKQGGTLSARVANAGVAIGGSIALAADAKPPVGATSQVYGDGSLRLHGWAFDSRDPQRALTVRAYLGHTLLAETVANEDHPSLRTHAVGLHGFSLDLPLALADGTVHSVRVVDASGAALVGSPLTVCCFAGGMGAVLGADSTPLLRDVARGYERYLPRSLSLQQYPEWSALFEPAAGVAPTSLTTCIIVSGDGDDAAYARTSASLAAQRGAAVTVLSERGKGKAKTFAALLQSAIDSGADLIGCVRAGDTLAPHALAQAAAGFAVAHAQLVYTDSEQDGRPWFKPAWDASYAMASDYPLELLLARRTLLPAGTLPATPAALGWRLLTAAAAPSIVHVPHVLYHFHSALSEAEHDARRSAAAAALAATAPQSTLLPLAHSGHAFQPRRVLRPLTARERGKRVSLIIPTRDHADLLARCIDSIERYTDWPKLEIIVVDNGSSEAATKTLFAKLKKKGVTILPMPGPFNFAALNNDAIAAATGDIVGMLNNDIEALHAGWLDEIVGQLLRPGVGAVGAKLLWPNGMVQHGGVLLGVRNVAGHFGNRLANADWGDHGRNQLLQEMSAVTGACLFLRKKDFLAVGGMDAVAFPVAFNDVDLCLKLRRAGQRIVWTPHATMLHAESASRGQEDTPQKQARSQREIDQLRLRWGAVLLRDPAYHPSLNLDAYSHAFGGLALPPRDRAPRTGDLATTSSST